MAKKQTKFIFQMLVGFLLGCSGWVIPSQVDADERPSAIVLLAGDLGYRDIDWDGAPVKTPNLDRLASNGIRFTDSYSGVNVCSPSHAVLLTGRQHMGTVGHGRQIFSEAGCIKCHRAGGVGEEHWPAMDGGVSKRFPREALLRQILEPSAQIEPSALINEKFQTSAILLTSGTVHSGLLADEDEQSVRLLSNPSEPTKIDVVKKSNIDERRISSVSNMPEGLLETFARDEILDLLAFVESEGKTKQ